MIRINPNSTPDMLNLLSQTQQREQQALQQLASGRRVNAPSDDPAAEATMIGLQAQAMDNDQFTRNISGVQQQLNTADSTLNSVVTALTRASTLGVQGANGTMSAADRAAIANDVQGIKDQVLSLANTSFHGNYLFSGTVANKPPYVADATKASGISYQGNDSVDSVPVGERRSVAVNQPGSAIFNKAGADVFSALQSLMDGLKSNDASAIATANNAVNAAFNQVTSARVFYGNTMNQLTAESTVLQSQSTQIASQQNSAVGADLAATATTLSQAQLAHQATLEAIAKVSGMSLLDYLR